jgi:putative thioredoxin
MALIGEKPPPIQAGAASQERAHQGRHGRQLHGRRDRGLEDPAGDRRLLGHLVRSLPPADPALEKAVNAAGGAVKLVKIDVDKNPGYSGQLRVQSIPTVYAFVDGQPVDGFQGAVPESEIKAFIARISGPPAESDIDALLAMAKESVELGDIGGAAQAFAQALQMDPENVKAIGGLAKCYLVGGDLEARPRWPPPRRPAPRTRTWTAFAPPWPWPKTRRPRPRRSKSDWPPTPTTTRPASSWPRPWPAPAIFRRLRTIF